MTAKKQTTDVPSNDLDIKADDKISLTKDELKGLVDKLLDDKLKAIPKSEGLNNAHLEGILDVLRDSVPQKNPGTRMVAESEIDVDDYLDIPATFFCYSFSYTLFGDMKYGRQVKSPYGTPIKFKPLYRYKRQGATKFSSATVSVSVATVRSKKELEWLRNHSLFNIKFFEKIGDAQNADVTFSEKVVETSNRLNSMSQFEVIERAKSEGIPISDDVDDIKRRLCFYLAEKNIKKPAPGPRPVDMNWNPSRTDEVVNQTY
tara:strand:- start:1730 stop:2509 length:780 start_codon:yes stop_codon:yes gene_type:complete